MHYSLPPILSERKALRGAGMRAHSGPLNDRARDASSGRPGCGHGKSPATTEEESLTVGTDYIRASSSVGDHGSELGITAAGWPSKLHRSAPDTHPNIVHREVHPVDTAEDRKGPGDPPEFWL